MATPHRDGAASAPRPDLDEDTSVGAAETRSGLTAAVPTRPKVSDAIIKSLRMDIAAGRLPLGAKLPTEKALAAHYGVSQPTVREAVRALDAMGLLETRHGSGVYVTKTTRDFVTTTLQTLLQMEHVGMLEAFNVRRVLGLYSATLACEHATPDDIQAMREAMIRCDEADNLQDLAEGTVAFQVAFSAAARNPLLFALEAFLVRLLQQFQIMANGDKGMKFWRRQAGPYTMHRHRMLDLLEKGDKPALVAEWTAYLDDLAALFSSDPILSTVSLSDPESIKTVDEIVLSMPEY